MIMADSGTYRLPDMFLRVEIRRRGGKKHDFQPRIVCQDLPYRGPTMPRRAIPQHEEWYIRIRVQQLLKMPGGGFRIHERFGLRHFRAREQVERSVEVEYLASGMHPYQRRLALGRPDRLGGGLEVQTGFIFSENDGLRGVLRDVRQFFSTCSLKAATSASLRERYCRSVRW